MAPLPKRPADPGLPRALAVILLIGLSCQSPTTAAPPQEGDLDEAALPEALRGPLAAELASIQVRYDDKLQPLLDVVLQACTDEQLAEYRRRRAENGGTADGQLQLARWCRRQGLAEEEQLHWSVLLSMEPDHPDAIKGLKLREYQGLLLTEPEIEEAKARDAAARQAARHWRPLLKKWKRDIEHGEPGEHAAALEQLRALDDPLALPVVEEIFGFDSATNALLLVETARRLPGEAASDLLARVAVESSDDYVRRDASMALETRAERDYVPTLLARLATPIELSVDVTQIAGGPIVQSYTGYSYTGGMGPAFYNKVRPGGGYNSADVAAWGPEVRRSSNVAVVGYEPDRVEYNYVLTREGVEPDSTKEVSGTIVQSAPAAHNARRVSSINELHAVIDQVNADSAALNRRIHAALTLATNARVVPAGLDPVDENEPIDPRWWWNWWRQKSINGYVSNGTEVWTITGPTPIEQVLVGDRILTRDEAGELLFSLVVGLDVQPESAMLSIEMNSRVILATPDQRFYVSKLGWKRASELKVGMQLDTLTGPQPIDNVAAGDAIACYGVLLSHGPNLFVDRHGIMAHDAHVAQQAP